MAEYFLQDLIVLSSSTPPTAGDVLTSNDGDFTSVQESVTFSTAIEFVLQPGGVDFAFTGGLTYTVSSIIDDIDATYTISDGAGGFTTKTVSSTMITIEEVGNPGNFITYLAPNDSTDTYPGGVDLPGITEIEIDFIDPAFQNANPTDFILDNDVTIAIITPDFTVDGTASDDVIDFNYLGDPEGDRIDHLDDAAGTNNDIVLAGAGNDTVTAGQGNDRVFGQAGNDTLWGNAGNDTLDGGTGNDTMAGGAGNDTLIGGSGDDRLMDTEAGTDTLWGGDGNDVFLITGAFGFGNIYNGGGLAETTGDTLNASSFTDNITLDLSQNGIGNPESGTLTTTTGSATFTDMENIILGTGNDTVIGSTGNDIVMTGPGNDVVTSGLGNDRVFGQAGNDTLWGGAGNDTLDGGTGNDTLWDEGGTDTLWGGNGDDLFRVGNDFGVGNIYNGGSLNETAGDTLNLFSMTDNATLDLSQNGSANPESGTLTTTNGSATFVDMENITLGWGNDSVIGSSGNDTVSAGAGNDTLIGNAGNDNLIGNAGDDNLRGGAGDDILIGAFGNDTLIDWEAGADTLLGGGGDDSFVINNNFGLGNAYHGNETADETGGDVLNAGLLTDDVILDLSQIGGTNPETGTLTSATGNATFTGMEEIFLGSGNDSVIGSTGNDKVFLGSGNNTVDGGAGNDQFFFDNTAVVDLDVVVFSDGDGDDIISGFDIPTDNGDGTFTGIDMLDVSGLTNFSGDPVDTADVFVTTNGSGDAVLGFPNGESLTFTGVTVAEVSSVAQLAAMGIPLPPTTAVFDLIQLNAGVPAGGANLTARDGDLIEIDEPITFTQSEAGVIKVDDTAVIDGVTYTVTFAGSGLADITHKDAGGIDEIVAGVSTRVVTLDDGAGNTLTYLIPGDGAGDIPDIGTISISLAGFAATDINTIFIDGDDDVTLVCFAGGTEIETADGYVPVETLTVGQMVQTMDHGPQPIRWIGRRKVAAVGKNAPIVFEEDAIGNKRELTVSPQHRMLVSDWKVELLFAEDQVLVAAKHMVNGTSIKQVEGGEVEYFHILFDRHEIIFADGCATESFYLGDESLKALGEITRQQFYKEFPALIDEAKNNKAHTARHCLKSFEAALLFDNGNSLPHESGCSEIALQNTRTVRPELIAQKHAHQGFA